MDFSFIQQLSQSTDSKIVQLVLDGLGGAPFGEKGLTALECAHTPNMDKLACQSSLGLMDTVHPGITPGSGPGHLGIFGYDPLKFQVGRGVLASLGVNFDLQASDVAARINFCTLDSEGLITDRRAGRISTEECTKRVELLQGITFGGIQCFVVPVKDHRAALVLRGEGLSGEIADTDPQQTGVAPLKTQALQPQAQKTAEIAGQFIAEAQKRLANSLPANGVLLRGFDSFRPLPSMEEVFKLQGAAIAVYPMYKGVSRLVGMDILDTGPSIEDQFTALENNFQSHSFFYVHIKKTDSYGEDGNFDGKVKIIEEVDSQLPRLLALDPVVVAITADHSTPASLKAHSWHPVPLLLHGPHSRYRDQKFSEKDCAQGDIGRIQAKHLMLLMLANSGKLKKFGA